MKRLAETLKLDYAQFLELELFTRFGSMSDARTRRTVLHGRRIRAILSQPQFQPRSLSIHVALLLSIHDQLLDELSSEAVDAFLARIGDGLSQRCRKAAARIDATGELAAEDRQDLSDALEELLKGTAEERG